MKTWTRTLAATAATAVVLSTAALPVHAASINGATSLKVPLSGSVVTDAGTLNLTGTVHLVIHPNDPYYPGDPYSPNDPYRVQANLVNVRATGPALSCRATGSQQFVVSGEDSVTRVGYRFEPLDPYAPAPGTCGGLEELTLRYAVNFDDDGTITGVDVQPVEGPLD